MHKVEVIPVIVRAWVAIPNSFFTVPSQGHFLKKRVLLLLKCFFKFQEATTVNSALPICCRIKSFQGSPGKIFNNLPNHHRICENLRHFHREVNSAQQYLSPYSRLFIPQKRKPLQILPLPTKSNVEVGLDHFWHWPGWGVGRGLNDTQSTGYTFCG